MFLNLAERLPSRNFHRFIHPLGPKGLWWKQTKGSKSSEPKKAIGKIEGLEEIFRDASQIKITSSIIDGRINSSRRI